mgnify:CR=1 FL=1
MNNNMIKVLGVVVIAAGLWWYLSKDADADPCAAHADATACGAAEGCNWTANTSEGAAEGAGNCAATPEAPAGE